MQCFVQNFVVVVMLFYSVRAQDDIEQVEVVVGRTAELPCNVTVENQNATLTVLAWYINGSTTAFYSSRDLRGGRPAVQSPSARYRLVSSSGAAAGQDRLQILAAKPSDAGLYTCFADFDSSPALKTHANLTVIEPPERLWVIHENGTRLATSSAGVNTSRDVGPYYIGDIVHLCCVTFGGKPQATLSWWTEKRKLKESSTPLSERRARSDLRYGPLEREDHGRILTCFARNNDHTTPLYIDVVINMLLPPELVALRDPVSRVSPARISEGSTLALQCRVLGARPPPPVVYKFLNGEPLDLEQNVTIESSPSRLVVSETSLNVTREHDEARVACCVPAYTRDQETVICSSALPITVLYPPALQIVVKEKLVNDTLTVLKGSTVTLNCSHAANPPVYQLIWFRQETLLSESDSSLQPTLVLHKVSDADVGEYVCQATNDEGYSYSAPLLLDVIYPAYCEDETTAQYGIRENEDVNITCNVRANPAPASYRWVVVEDAVDLYTLRNQPQTTLETEEPILTYQRPNDTAYSTLFCWGMNSVSSSGLPHTPCVSLVSAETAPRPPAQCTAYKNTLQDISIVCEKGHDGGLPQKFLFVVKSLDSNEQYMSIQSLEPKFMIEEPAHEEYKFVIIAFNEKGNSTVVEIDKNSIIGVPEAAGDAVSVVADLTTLALALCGGVALLALTACGLVLCAQERHDRRVEPHGDNDPPLCAYNTEESNCDTYHGSDDGSECNVRRTESFRRAIAKYPSKNFDVRRTSSFHSARYVNDMAEQDSQSLGKCSDGLRHGARCRVHSLQNISKKRDMDAMCIHLPPEVNYIAPRPMNTFYTMPRKMRHKMAKEISDETSEITQASDGFSLPPPPDEYGTYRAATRIRDVPRAPAYTAMGRRNSGKETKLTSAMNTVGLPTVSGHNTLYSYPGDRPTTQQVTTNPFDEDSS